MKYTIDYLVVLPIEVESDEPITPEKAQEILGEMSESELRELCGVTDLEWPDGILDEEGNPIYSTAAYNAFWQLGMDDSLDVIMAFVKKNKINHPKLKTEADVDEFWMMKSTKMTVALWEFASKLLQQQVDEFLRERESGHERQEDDSAASNS